MDDVLHIDKSDGVAMLWLDVPGARVNTISQRVFDAFESVLEAVAKDAAVRAVVLISRKPDSFVAGADLNMIRALGSAEEAEALSRSGQRLAERWRTLVKPTVAAIHGAAMGGGLEMALACTYRIATDHEKTRLALPEVQLGLLPALGGTQNLPRLVGLQQALSMMLTGKNVYPRPARRMGLVDALVPAALLPAAAREAARRLAEGALQPGGGHPSLPERLVERSALTRRILYQKAEARIRKESHGNYPAPFALLDAVRTGMEEGRAVGLQVEARHFGELVVSPPARALIGLFFARQAADKNPYKEQARPVRTVGVLGAGLMGAGIAEVTAARGMDVVLKDQTLELAAHGKQQVWQSMSRLVAKGARSAFERDVTVERVVPVEEYAALASADLVIEAVPEDLDLKRRILADTEAVTREDTVFASNTSSIPISEIAAASSRPHTVLGMHYFSPVPLMPLVEIVRTDQTADWALATAYETGLRQGKTVVVVGDGPGFYTTRILALYLNEALLMLEEGADVEQIDAAMEQFGFPMGPFELADLVGLDVAAKIADVMGERLSGRVLKMSTAASAMVQAGYRGQKSGSGFYRYERAGEQGRPRKKGLNEPLYTRFGGQERTELDRAAIQERLALMMVNEAARCLEEGILRSATDGDLAAVFGLGFPPFRGGPFHYINQEGAASVVARLQRLEQAHGPRFAPAPMLQERKSVEG